MDIKIVFHPSGDWEGLYINGELKDEGHSIYTETLITALQEYLADNYTPPINSISYSTRDLDNEEGFDEEYDFPLKYEDIKI